MSDPVQLSYTVAAPWLQNDLWLLNEEDVSWNCYTGTLSFDGHYNLCKTGYQSISSTGTLSWKMFHWLGLNDKVPRQLSYGVVVPELYEKQVSFKKEVGVMVNDLVFWLTVCLILKMCY